MLEAIESLPEKEREAFSLVRIQGMTQNEAAQLLNVSTATVKRRLYCAQTKKLAGLRPGSASVEVAP
jgi:RNA polymerase sigma factor (sigma-70 family)